MTIDVIDYGVGNLASVHKALAFVGATPIRAASPGAITDSRALVVPGVGHFDALRALEGPWRDAVFAAVARGIPVLGICLGMQWLFDGSREASSVRGLGVLNGTCEPLSGDVKVPHVGWNQLKRSDRPSRLLDGITSGDFVYFTHSFAAPVTDVTVASTTHGSTFASVVEHRNCFGVQWHPEKSGTVGLMLLSNFVAIAERSSC